MQISVFFCTFAPYFHFLIMYHVKYSKLQVEIAIRKMARKLKKEHIVHEDTVYIVMLTGGVWFACHLFDALGNASNEVHYIKGHSYAAKERCEFMWDYLPEINVKGRDVVILDDICDSGETLKIVHEHFSKEAHSVIAVTLMQRIPRILPENIRLYACIDDHSTQFFVGCGLDNNGRGRLLNYVGTVK